MAREDNEIVVNFDYYGDSLVLAESDDDDHAAGAHPGEARVEVDPLVEAFARSPYDPVIGAMMMGRATGEVVARPPEIRWMRVITYRLAIGLVAQLPLAYYFGVDFRPLGGVLSSSSVVLSPVFAAAGLLLLLHLLLTEFLTPIPR
ncbi:hypothetical protein BH23CHL2_BH23CHL2_05320 [soil metagenome]